MAIISTGRQIGQTIKNAGRLRQIVGTFARYGFHNLAERARLGRFILRRMTRNENLEKLSTAERVRRAFEELGPTFVKLGQLLATRPNLIPPDFVEEFKKFHDSVTPVSFEEVSVTLKAELGDPNRVFSSIDPTPLAAASIAQVHCAKLVTGQDVVIKVQRPGIKELIEDDLGVLYQLAELIEKYVPEARPFNPVSIVDEFFKSLQLEVNFVVEANNMRRMHENFKSETSVKIPHVYLEHTTEKVLVMERLLGIPLSDPSISHRSDINPEEVVRAGLRAFFKMVFSHGLFHGDLHAGNLFILPGNVIGLVDFGVVGRLSPRTKSSVAAMFVALFTEDYERLAAEYLELAPYNPQVDFDQFTRDLRELLSPWYGLTFKNVNLGKILMDSASLASKHQIILPSELMLYFKAIMTVEGMGRMIIKDFDLLSMAMEFATELIKAKYDPQRMLKEFAIVAHDMKVLLLNLPRQTRSILRRINSHDFALDVQVKELDRLTRSVETSGALTYLGIVVASLIIASTMTLTMGKGPEFYDIPVISLVGYFFAFSLSSIAFLNHLRR